MTTYLSSIVQTENAGRSAIRWIERFAGGVMNDISERQDFMSSGKGSIYATAFWYDYIPAHPSRDYNDPDVVFPNFSIGLMTDGTFGHLSSVDAVAQNIANVDQLRLMLTHDTSTKNLYIVALGGGLDSYLLIEMTALDTYYINTINLAVDEPKKMFQDSTPMTLADVLAFIETIVWPVVSSALPEPSAVAALNTAAQTGGTATSRVDFFAAAVMTPTIASGSTVTPLTPATTYVPPVSSGSGSSSGSDASAIAFTPSGNLTATDVAAALVELDARPNDSVAANTYTSTSLTGVSDLQAALAAIDAALSALGQ